MKTKDIFQNWNAFLTENRHAQRSTDDGLLKEITEEESEVIQGVLEEMDGDVLAFNKMFDGKNRIIIPFEAVDFDSDLGMFLAFFTSLENKSPFWEVNYEEGTVSREKPMSADQLLKFATWRYGRRPPVQKQKVKIGKFLSNLARMLENVAKNNASPESRKRIEKTFGRALSKRIHLADLFKVRGSDEAKDVFANSAKVAKQLAKVWQQKADIIKKGGGKGSTYSIILTRHPIDILRMSDFDQIESCHSPPSRGGASEYYKCAIAEAHGHGALAYVVKTEELEELFEEKINNIENNEDFQEEEVFLDDEREVSGVVPINRLRLRQIRFYDADKQAQEARVSNAGNNTIGGTEIALPESRIYGFPRIKGFREAVIEWAWQAQEKEIDNIPINRAGAILGSRIVKFGGSYEDNVTSRLITDLTGRDVYGRTLQNRKTEDNLDYNPYASQLEDYRALATDQNRRFDYFKVLEIDAEEGGIDARFIITFEWDATEWTSLPNFYDLRYLPSEVGDLGGMYDILSDIQDVWQQEGKIKMTFLLNIVNFMEAHGVGDAWQYDLDDFDRLLRQMDLEEYEGRSVPAIKEAINLYLKREGFLVGSAFFNLANEVESGQIESYEWDLNPEGDYPEYYEVNATTTIYDVPTNGASANLIKKVIESRAFKLKLRETILEAPKAETDPEAAKYFLDSVITPKSIDENEKTFDVKISFSINEDDREARVFLFRALLEETDDEDYLREAAQKAFLATVKMVPGVSNISERQLFTNWKTFLKG